MKPKKRYTAHSIGRHGTNGSEKLWDNVLPTPGPVILNLVVNVFVTEKFSP